ncbi:capsid cement protein [Bradyrhizobium japonicum]|uniref:capsid cement protein n=1 Tax=Bradyrhizobium japonicum TaxID=375 RepID=UPI001BAB9598|nr:capsid cement protein [Bradyrhizobium japonicum]MBR0962242.1 DUF2190 family protein [Bradyrhizobium japonicum]
MIPTFIRSYITTADVAAFKFVKFSDAAASKKVATASAATDPIIGASDSQGGSSGNTVDVIRRGLAQVTLGGTVAAGDPLTSDASGNAIKLVAASGVIKRLGGFAEEPGVAGDVIDFMVADGIVQLP